MVDSGKTIDGAVISYEITDSGYNIYNNGRLWITQPKPFDKLYVPDGTYEENALAQIDELVTANGGE